MEPDGSLPHSQMPATCPILSQFHPVHTPKFYFLKIHLNIIPLICAWVSQAVSFPQVSTPKHCIRLSSPPYVLHATSILFSQKTYLALTFDNDQHDVQIFNTFITILYMYMFRAISCSSSGGQIVLILRLLMSYIYGAPILDVSRSYTTTQHSR